MNLPPFPAESAAAARTIATRAPANLTVATWNVWFDRTHMRERYTALLLTILTVAPDAIGFQEVVPRLADALRSNEAVSALYSVSPNEIRNYGCLLLVRKDLQPSFTEVAMPTSMGRTLLVAELGARPGTQVATVHLESLDSEVMRQQQLQVAAEALGRARHAVLVGDFNFDDRRTWGEWRDPGLARPAHRLENARLGALLPRFVDAWHAVRGAATPGLTFDGASNPHVRDAGERMRYDRVMVRGMRPVQIEMLGVPDLSLPPEDHPVPSDHFGLLCTMTLHDERVAEALVSKEATKI